VGAAGEPEVLGATQRLLLGRDREMARLDGLIEGVRHGGGALVVRGEPGIGKSALLKHSARRASDRGMGVLTTAGAQSELNLAFAGLHRLLLPFLGGVWDLPPLQRSALEAAFGRADAEALDIFLVGVASLGLIADAAADSPVLLVVDDAQWLDGPSAQVLAFVARRLEPEQVVVLFGLRDGVSGGAEMDGLPEIRLDPLDDDTARSLLRETAGDLPVALCDRIVRDALGNPLALIELPRAVARAGEVSLIQPLPLTERLEQVFAARLGDLSLDARTLLLLSALDAGGRDELCRAAEMLLGRPVATGGWDEISAAGLGELAGEHLEFRHPLVVSAVHQAASADERRQAHHVLALVLAGDPDRGVWHAAAAATTPDERVSSELEAAAERAAQRGGREVAVVALQRAAELSGTSPARKRRLLRAAEVALEIGRSAMTVRLLEDASALDLAPHERARVEFWLEVLRGDWSGADGIRAFARAAETLIESGDSATALETLHSIAVRAYWSHLDDETRRELVAVTERLDVGRDEPRRVMLLAHADPVGHATQVIATLETSTPTSAMDPRDLFAFAAAGTTVWAANLALPFHRAAVEGFRREGRLTPLAEALVYRAWEELRCGHIRDAAAAAAEAERLADETQQSLYAVAARLARAIVDLERGNQEAAETMISSAETVLVPMGANPLLAVVTFARGRLALAGERVAEAHAHFVRTLNHDDVAFHPFAPGWMLADIVEAAILDRDDVDRIARFVGDWQQIADATGAPHLVVQLAYVRALMAGEDDEAEALFEVTLGTATKDWPYYRARAQLAYGAWLRRHRRMVDSRAPLRAAVQTFDGLGIVPSAARARRELRASGETARRRPPDAWDHLTPQELQIAQLAAEGLSNRAIGERLYLSHRTVGSHLYRLFPKLGVTSRGQLRRALGSAADE